MWRVVGSALAARRGQAAMVALVTLLATAALAAAPWYAVAATQRVTVAAVAGAPVPDRMITVTRHATQDEPAPADPMGQARRQLSPAGFTPIAGGLAELRLPAAPDGSGAPDPAPGGGPDGAPDAARTVVNLAYRDGVCGHLLVTGACPPAGGEVLVPTELAAAREVAVGDPLPVRGSDRAPGELRVVGVYRVADRTEPYWGVGDLVGIGDTVAAGRETLFTGLAGLSGYGDVDYTYELVADPEEFATIEVDEQARARLVADIAELERQNYQVTTDWLGTVADRITQDRRNVRTGVGIGVAVLLLFTWFTLVVILRGAVVQIRGDVGWWRLHGLPAGRGWFGALAQHGLPLLAGGLLGAGVGLGLGWGLAGTVEDATAHRTALLLALALVGLALAGGLVATVATQLDALRAPVRELLRRVPARGRRWRRSVVDLVVLTLAATAAGQTLAVGPEVEGLAWLAPGLSVAALALVAAWAVPPLVTALAGRALRAGRLVTALIAASMARGTGTHRLFAVVAVAVGLVTTGLVGWHTAAGTQTQRATFELGADRVVTVAAVDPARLLAAVRAADPTGTRAMAVVRRPGGDNRLPVLAVDSTRLSVVTGWRETVGDPDAIAAALRPAAPPPVVVAADQLVLEAAAGGPVDPGAPLHLGALLRTPEGGEPVTAVFGPLGERRDRYRAPVPECAGGCRLVGLRLLGPPRPDAAGPTAGGGPGPDDTRGGTFDAYAPPPSGARVDLFRLATPDRTAVPGGARADLARWRGGLGPRDLGPAITTAPGGGLRMTVPELPQAPTLRRDEWVFVLDAPAPLPVLVAGAPPDQVGEVRLAPLGEPSVPAEVVGSSTLVPALGERGAVVDLEYAERLTPFATGGGTSQVWLSPTAPPSTVADLRAAGLRPLREESIAGRTAELAAEGSAVGVRFQAVVALVGLALAAGAVLVSAAQQRAGQAAQLAALRAQGLSARVVRRVGYGTVAAVVGTATAVGLVAGLVGVVLARVQHPGFVDGWAVLPTAPPHPGAVAAAAAAAAVVLGGAVLAAGLGLVRRTRERPA